MSYDLTVYCPDSPTIDKVALLVGNTRGLHVDPENSDESGVLVLRGVKRAYSFTVDGPVALEPEDLPDEVSGVLPDANTMFQVLVEGTVESEIIHGVRFAKKLAKSCHGVTVDEQTGEVWPKPRVVKPVVPKVSPYKDLIHFSWYALADEMPADLPERYVRLAKECLPEALPVRFGDYEPYQGDFVRDGVEGLMRQWKDSPPLSMIVTADLPIKHFSMEYLTQGTTGDSRHVGMSMAREALEDDELRARTKEFFIRLASEMGAFHAYVEVIPLVITGGVPGYPIYSYADITRSSAPRREETRQMEWVGLQPYPQWWTWFGPLYADLVRSYLTGQLEEHPQGIFHSWTEKPADRREITRVLPDPEQPWIPQEFCGVYEDEKALFPSSLAVNVPQRLREVRMPLHQYED
ncbi:hypothetical protein [Arthrobacter sp. 18067]|uniref:hypothetical protein n=1 Tax=Arthrobacter sp. 18067 TaxID=2681413 RepID=UPI001357BBF1|nr:hypothetical protein [Arthrobacter sp. 18067]